MQNQIIQNLVSEYKKGRNLQKSPLLTQLLEQYDYFEYQRDQKNVIQQLSENVQIHYQPKNTFLFHKNQYSDYLYILLEGEAIKLEEKDEYDIAKEFKLINDQRNIQDLIKLQQSKQQDVSKLRKENGELKLEISELNTRNEEIDQLVKEHCGQTFKSLYFNPQIDEDINLFKITERIMPGNMFGQISCVDQFDQRRMFSIFAYEECRLVSIKLSHIQQILSEKIKIRSYIFDYFNYFEVELNSLIDSRQFNLYFEEKTFNQNQQVINQNEKDDHCFYLICEGKFQYSYSFNSETPSSDQQQQIQKNKNLLEMSAGNSNLNQFDIFLIYLFNQQKGDLFGHEQRSRNDITTRNQQRSNQLRPFNIICNQDNSKVIKIQSLLLQFKISERNYAQILNSGFELYKKLIDEVGVIPNSQQQNNSTTIQGFQKIKRIVKMFQQQNQNNGKEPISQKKLQVSENFSPVKKYDNDSESLSPLKDNMNSPRHSRMRQHQNKIVFRIPFKKQASQSQRQSPITIRDSPKVEIKQRLVFNLSKEFASKKFKHQTTVDQAYKSLSQKIDNIPTNFLPLDQGFKPNNQESNNTIKLFRTPQHNQTKSSQSLQTTTNYQSITNTKDNFSNGFTDSLNLYIKHNNSSKIGSIFQKLEKPKLSSSNQSTQSTLTNLQINRSTSMIFPSSMTDLKQEDKLITETEQFQDNQLFNLSQAQLMIKKKISAFSYQKQNSLQIYQMQEKLNQKNQIKQPLSNIKVDGKGINNLLFSIKNVENTERCNIYNAISSLPESPTNKLYTQTSKLRKRPSLVLDLKLLRSPVKSQEKNN